MAQAPGVTAGAELNATKASLIAKIVQRELASKAMMVSRVQDYSMYAIPGSKQVSIPKTGSLSVANRPTGEAGALSNLSFSTDTLLLDQNAYVAWLVDSMDAVQSSVDVQQELISRAISAHGRNVDAAILNMLFGAASESTTGAVTSQIIRDLRAYLLEKNANIDDLTLAVNVQSEAVMLGLPEFVQANYYGSAVIPQGVIGKVYGVPVLVHNAMPANVNAIMFERSAGAVAFQRGASYGEQPAIQYGVNSKICAVDQLFGVKAMQVGQAGAAANTSPLIAALTIV